MNARQADFATTKQILESSGIPVAGKVAAGPDEALAAAAQAGYPVVMKLLSPDLVHKSDVGVVILDIETPGEARVAYETLQENGRKAGARRLDGVLVQKQARPGFELMVGARQDPLFGPLTLVGTGGKYVELCKDVAPGVGELSREDVLRMLSETAAGRVIDGFRGPPLDREAVVDLVMKVSRLMESRPEVNELDLNPVILYPKGFSVVDARLILDEPVQHPRMEDLSPQRLKSLEAIFEARSAAVVGASRPGTIGGIVLKNCSRLPKVYPVNPKHDALLGLKCYPSIKDLPEMPDIAVFVIPPEATIRGFRDFCAAGGKGAVVVSDGFAEIGRTDLEDELRAVSEKAGVVYIGPNAMGVGNNYTGLNTLFMASHRTDLREVPGSVGIISQSGGIALELMEMAAFDNLRIGKWVSCGNASGVSIPELLAHMGDDSRIKVIAIYIEGLRNGLQFMQVGKKVAEKKPVIVIKGGTGGGAAATMSHTASLAGSFEAFKAACRQAGFYLIEELTEDPKILINVVSMITTQKRARDNRVAVVSVGGGAAILLADQVTSQGLRLATFSPETRTRLAGFLGDRFHAAGPEHQARIAERAASNPLDLLGNCDDDRLLETIRILDRDPDTDMIVCGIYFQVPYLTEYIGERLVELKRELHKPLVISPRGFSSYVQRTRRSMTDRDVNTYTVPMIKPLSIALDIWKRYDLDFTV
jgi:3-hydroxypropionyl-CoA synthetase (ADP-forming)